MSTVETVRGPVDVSALGRTLMHEHVFVMRPEALQNFGHVWGSCYWDEDVRIADAVEKLRTVRAAGIETVVDATAYGLGRFVPRLQRINAEVDLNLIVATGVYAFLELPNFLGYRSVDAISELFVREIREGIDDTGVKAAFIKCAVERHGIIGDIPKILAAVSTAAIETGVPVMVHTNAAAGTRPARARGALTFAGVEPGRIVIAHAGDSNDLAYLRAIADTGAWLGCDRFSIEHFNPDAQRIETLVKPARGGLRRPRPPLPRRRVLHRLHGRRPRVRERAAELPAHLDEDPPGPAGRRSHRRADRRADDRESSAVLRALERWPYCDPRT